jgi:hypothetical protein
MSGADLHAGAMVRHWAQETAVAKGKILVYSAGH